MLSKSSRPICVCSKCEVEQADVACLCTFPLTYLCPSCSIDHQSSTHSGQLHTLCDVRKAATITSKTKLEWWQLRIYRVMQVQEILKSQYTAIQRANDEIDTVANEIAAAVEEQRRSAMLAIQQSKEKLDAIWRCLDQMKSDDTLRSGTSLDTLLTATDFDKSQIEANTQFAAYSIEKSPLPTVLIYFFKYSDSVPDLNVYSEPREETEVQSAEKEEGAWEKEEGAWEKEEGAWESVPQSLYSEAHSGEMHFLVPQQAQDSIPVQSRSKPLGHSTSFPQFYSYDP